jgi:G3E family GTPase
MHMFQVSGVVTLVDSVNVRQTVEHYSEAMTQIALADTLLITKTDMENADLDITQLLQTFNPYAQIMDVQDASISVLSMDYSVPRQTASAHHHHHHDIKAFCLTHDQPISHYALNLFLDLLTSTHGAQILRMKGLVMVQDQPYPLLINGVQKIIHPLQWLEKWPSDARATRLVIIGKALNPSYVNDLFAAFTHQPKIDTPDAEALYNNPLALI